MNYYGIVSIYKRECIVSVNEKKYDISYRIPAEIWEIGGDRKSEEDKRDIKLRLCQEAEKFICEKFKLPASYVRVVIY